MRSIGVLECMRKKKHMAHRGFSCRSFFAYALIAAFLFLSPTPAGAAQGDRTLGTRSGNATIENNSANGDRTMKTPDPKPQDQYQGPQTIIVSPEVYPDRQGGARPPSGKPGGHKPKPTPKP